MNGIELARAYYETYGAPMLRESFPELLPHVAVGIMGPGSDALGFDDESSRDHDFGPGFTVFLSDEETVTRREAFLLERAYAKLPDEFMGFHRQKLSPAGGNRFGVVRTVDFFKATVGSPDGRLTTEQWLSIPEQYLLEATDGAVFYDGSGEVNAIRSRLLDMPEDVRLKKAAGYLTVGAQAGSYNLNRCLSHGETGAASLSLSEFVKAMLHLLYVLNHAYMPYYKWSFRGAEALSGFTDHMTTEKLLSGFETLLTTGYSENEIARKREIVQETEREACKACRRYLETIGRSGATDRTGLASDPYRIGGADVGTDTDAADPGRVAETLNSAIADPAIRNLHIMAAAVL